MTTLPGPEINGTLSLEEAIVRRRAVRSFLLDLPPDEEPLNIIPVGFPEQ